MSSTAAKLTTSSNECKENNNNDSTKKESHDDRNTRDIDGGWAWIVLSFNSIAAVLCSGQYLNNGLYFYIFLKTFGQSRSMTMWITASQCAANGLVGIISGRIIVKHGYRKTMFLGSIIMGTSYAMMFFANSVPYAIVCFTAAGVGSSFIQVTYITSLAKYFNKKHSIATGIVLAGSAIGTAIIGLEIEWAVDAFGWRGSMLIQSGLLFQICVCAATLYYKIPSPKQKTSSPESDNNSTTNDNADNVKSRKTKTPTTSSTFLYDARFWFLLIGFAFNYASMGTILQILKDFVVSNDFSFQYGVVMICNGAANCIGRVCGGILASFVEPTLLTSYVAILCGLSITMMLFTSIEQLALGGIMLFAFTNGIQGPAHAVSCVRLFGEEHMASVYGYSFATGILPTLVISPLAGYIVDETGSFVLVIILASICMIMCGISFLLVRIIHMRKLGIHTFDHNNLNITPAGIISKLYKTIL